MVHRPKRFTGPYRLAWTASISAVALATIHNLGGNFDPTLAVLTATLIAVVWYAYFTYLAIHRAERVHVALALGGSVKAPLIKPKIRNSTTTRTIEVKMFVDVLRNGEHLESDPAFAGGPGHEITLIPGADWEGGIAVDPPKTLEGSPFGPRVALAEADWMCVRYRATWVDDLGDEGEVGPLYWRVSVLDPRETKLLHKAVQVAEYCNGFRTA